jgi:hypothetical protein
MRSQCLIAMEWLGMIHFLYWQSNIPVYLGFYILAVGAGVAQSV